MRSRRDTSRCATETNRSRRLRLRAGVAAVVAVGGALGAYWVHAAHEPRIASAAVRVPVEGAAAVGPGIDLGRLGAETTYEATVTRDVTIAFDQLLGYRARAGDTARQLGSTLTGAVKELSLDHEARTALLRMEDPSFVTGGRRTAAIEAALKRGVVIAREPNGNIARVRFPKDADVMARAALRGLADALEWSAGEGGAWSWRAESPGAEGTVQARYDLSAAGERSGFVRRIERLVRPGRRPPGLALTGNETGELRGEIDARTMAFVSISGSETVTQDNASGERAATAVTTISFVRTGARTDVAAALRASGSLDADFDDWIAIDDLTRDVPRLDSAAREKMLEGRSAADLIRDLHSGDGQRLGEAQSYLKMLLEAHPEAAAEIARDAASGAITDPATRAELSALASTGSAQAQRGLADVLGAWKDRPDATSAAMMFAQLRAPTRETVEYLQSLQKENPSSPYAATIDTSLGSMAAHLKESDPARADAIAQGFEERLRATSDPAETTRVLTALGDASSPRILDVAPSYLTSDDATVRRAAAFALGRIGDDDARAILERLAKDDPDARVRMQAAQALSGHAG